MTILIQSLLIIIPIIGLIAGLSLSFTIPLFLLACLYRIKDQAIFSLKHSKIEICFTIWLALSCFWSIDILNSMFSFLKTFSVAIVVYILISNKDILIPKISLSTFSLFTAILASIALFYFEYYSDGYISTSFREIVQKKKDSSFYLHYLDRGCTLLALFAWFVIAVLIKNYKNILAVIIYIITAYTLYLSDSLAGFVGFALSGLVFITTRYWPFNNSRILSAILIICSVLFISGIYAMQPRELSDNQAKSLPISAKHRLFIWDFAFEKFANRPFVGYGFNSSRKIKLAEEDFIEYENLKLSPLPLHPHNNLLQIMLETGIIGLIFYLSLAAKYLNSWNLYFKRAITPNILNIRAAGYACFSTFFIISMISFNMWQSWWLCCYLWIATLFCLLISDKD